jgi:glycine dehydrogenase
MLGARSTVRGLLSRVLSKTVKSFAACKPAAPLAALQKRSFAAESTKSILDFHDGFVNRHIGPTEDADVKKMLKVIGYNSLDALIDATVPASIRIARPLQLDGPKGEAETLAEFKEMMSANKVFKSYLGAGYFNTITPPVILRNIIENPAWYTPYTPYQAEIAQGRLEMLLNFQTMICDLTGFPVANASLLDEATAAAEAMTMCFNSGKDAQNVLLVSSDVNPATLAVLRTR